MRRECSTRIVATLGPSSTEPEVIEALFEAGTDVFRLNMSHGDHADHARRHAAIRALERKRNRPIGIMADLQGPKLRVGTLAEGAVTLVPGARFRLDLNSAPGSAERVCLPHPEIFAAVTEGQDLLIDDGKLRVRVVAHGKDWADTEVVVGGKLSNRKGVNVPQAILPLAALTEKDLRDLNFMLGLGVDYVALSFVQRPDDVAQARKLIDRNAGILVKVEKPSAITCLDELVDLADALMVARGDLGVELPAEDVPPLQRRIVRACRRAGKPVVVATQMLESMIQSPTPTRAEASDVATAVYDGADAVMLSAETASGSYPVEAVTIMHRIITRTEADDLYRPLMMAETVTHEATTSDAIAAAAAQTADTIRATCIVTYSNSGRTALRVARERPPVPILGLTAIPETARRMMLTWGVHGMITPDCTSFDEMVDIACRAAESEAMANPRDLIVITAGVPFGRAGATNILRVARIPD